MPLPIQGIESSECVAQDGMAAPSNAFEQERIHAAQTDRPIATVRRRTPHRVISSQRRKGRVHIVRRDRGTIAADAPHAFRTREGCCKGRRHACAEVGTVLPMQWDLKLRSLLREKRISRIAVAPELYRM